MNKPIKTAKTAIDSIADPRIDRHVRTSLRRTLDSAAGFVVLACFLSAANSSRAGQPAFIATPPAILPVTTSTQAQGPLRVSADLNQAAMSQIINQLNQRQFQLSAVTAQASVQHSVFGHRTVSIRRGK